MCSSDIGFGIPSIPGLDVFGLNKVPGVGSPVGALADKETKKQLSALKTDIEEVIQPDSIPQSQLDAQLAAITPGQPSAREKTATEVLSSSEQRRRQSLAGRLGVQQLRAGLLNVPK